MSVVVVEAAAHLFRPLPIITLAVGVTTTLLRCTQNVKFACCVHSTKVTMVINYVKCLWFCHTMWCCRTIMSVAAAASADYGFFCRPEFDKFGAGVWGEEFFFIIDYYLIGHYNTRLAYLQLEKGSEKICRDYSRVIKVKKIKRKRMRTTSEHRKFK